MQNSDLDETLSPKEIELKAQKINAYTKRKIRVFCFSASLTLLIILIMAGGGYALDILLKTESKKFFILGLALGYPLTQYLLYRKYKPKKSLPFTDIVSTKHSS